MVKLATPLTLLLVVTYFVACEQPGKTLTVATSTDYKKGESFYDTNSDSAFYYFNSAAASSRDSLEIAMAYSYMGIIQSGAGDYFGSQESLLQSLTHLDERNIRDQNCLLSDFNELGRVSLNLKNYDAAIAYYDKALQFIDDEDARIIVLSNKAVVYQKKQQYVQANALYDSILSKSKDDKKRYARILSNMAFTKWLKDSGYRAAPELLQALQIQEHKNDNWGLNASYAHLSGYYFQTNPDSALMYANRMYRTAQVLNSPDDELEALQKMIALNAPGAVKIYFTRYQYLNDSLQISRNNAKNQFALIRYEVAKNKADNLSLQKDNAEKKFQVILLIVALSVLVIVAIFIYRLLQKRRQQMLQEQQLKTSQKVHDVVANGICHIIAKIEHEEPGKEALLDDLEIIYQQSRNISYDEPETISENYAASLTAMLSSFSTSEVSVSIVGNENITWEGVATKVKNELHYILKELMINMKKHSEAGNVVIHFERDVHLLHTLYADDGKGTPDGFQYKNGLRNTENRMATVGGHISFESSAPKGLKIQMSIPI